jgi:hypothetical protein
MRFIVFVLTLGGAEAMGSWWIWARCPSDSLRVSYPNFGSFEVDRLRYWFAVFACAGILSLAVRHLRSKWANIRDQGTDRHNRVRSSRRWWIFGVIFALGVELSTSGAYWKSSRSSNVRSLYQSAWYLHRVPRASDLGWPSSVGYMVAHLVPWAAVLFLCFGIWSLWNGSRRIRPSPVSRR